MAHRPKVKIIYSHIDSSFSKETVSQTLVTQAKQHLQLELEAFDDADYRTMVAAYGDTGLEDLQPFLGKAY